MAKAEAAAPHIMMNQQHIDWATRRSKWIMLAGLALATLGGQFQTFGLITGVCLITLGAGAASLASWRQEPGLWMLACVLLALFLPTYAIFEYESLAGGSNDSRPSFWEVADSIFAAAVLLFQVRFFVTVAKLNWRLSRHIKDARTIHRTTE